MERSNKILKAKQDGILKMEEMKQAYENVGIIIGHDSAYVAQQMMQNALMNNEAGARITYPPVRVQVEQNADAIINPMMNKEYRNTSNKEMLDKVVEFYNNLEIHNKEFIKKYDAELKSKKLL